MCVHDAGVCSRSSSSSLFNCYYCHRDFPILSLCVVIRTCAYSTNQHKIMNHVISANHMRYMTVLFVNLVWRTVARSYGRTAARRSLGHKHRGLNAPDCPRAHRAMRFGILIRRSCATQKTHTPRPSTTSPTLPSPSFQIHSPSTYRVRNTTTSPLLARLSMFRKVVPPATQLLPRALLRMLVGTFPVRTRVHELGRVVSTMYALAGDIYADKKRAFAEGDTEVVRCRGGRTS